MEEQCAPRFGEWDVTQFINDDTVQRRQLSYDFPGISFGLFLDQGIDKIDGVEEPGLLAVVD